MALGAQWVVWDCVLSSRGRPELSSHNVAGDHERHRRSSRGAEGDDCSALRGPEERAGACRRRAAAADFRHAGQSPLSVRLARSA